MMPLAVKHEVTLTGTASRLCPSSASAPGFSCVVPEMGLPGAQQFDDSITVAVAAQGAPTEPFQAYPRYFLTIWLD